MNQRLAQLLNEIAGLLEKQRGNAFRVRAYRQAAAHLLGLPHPIEAIYRRDGEPGIQAALHVGERLASAIGEVIMTGDLPLLHRLRAGAGTASLLESVAGIGPNLAARLSDELGIHTLEDLEAAAYDGRLAHLGGFGPKRLAGIRDSLASRLGRLRPSSAAGPAAPPPPAVAELLDIDREYRESAAAGRLRRIAPRRFNPAREAWLPILRTRRGGRAYSALYSNTPRAHQLGRTRDWVVIYEENGAPPRPWTVVTASRGVLSGRRVVRGREPECAAFYRAVPPAAALAATAT